MHPPVKLHRVDEDQVALGVELGRPRAKGLGGPHLEFMRTPDLCRSSRSGDATHCSVGENGGVAKRLNMATPQSTQPTHPGHALIIRWAS